MLVRDTNYTVTDMLTDDRISELFREELAALRAQHRARPEVFLIQMERARTVHVGGPLHVEVQLTTDRQDVTVSVGIMRGSGRMPKTAVRPAQRETAGPAASGDQRGWPTTTNGSSLVRHRS